MNQACEAPCEVNIVIHARVDDDLDQAALPLARAMHRRGPRPQSALRDESSEMKTLDFIQFMGSKVHAPYLEFGDMVKILSRFLFACKCVFWCLSVSGLL